MVYQAPIVTAVILACKAWQRVATRMEAGGKKLPMYLHWFTALFLLLTVLFVMAVHSMYADVMTPSNWLDPAETDAFVKSVMETDDMDKGSNLTGSFKSWSEEASMRGYGPLVTLSLFSPVFVLGTILVSIHHSVQHAQKIAAQGGGQISSAVGYLHDSSIFILALPCVYGLMSFKSVIRCWQAAINHVGSAGGDGVQTAHIFNGFKERREFLDEMYEANFCVGDIYETLGLIAFGKLICSVLETRIKKRMKLPREDSTPGSSNYHTLNDLLKSMSKMTVAGVQLFCLSCVLQASYILLVTTVAFSLQDFNILPKLFGTERGHLGLLQQASTKKFVKTFFSGFGFAASFAAINNIMQIESDFHTFLEGEHKKGHHSPSPENNEIETNEPQEHLVTPTLNNVTPFGSFLKFWGTKVLVTLACVQSVILSITPPFSSWPALHVNLLYATILCIECFVISILHMNAWKTVEAWYQEGEESEKTGFQQPLLQ